VPEVPRDRPPTNLGPSAGARRLDEEELEVLAGIGRHWRTALGRAGRRATLPVDPSLVSRLEPRGPTRFGRVVNLGAGAAELEATRAVSEPASGAGRLAARARRLIIGAPLASTALVHERMRKVTALPVLSSDALSSIAYGPEALLSVLVLAGGTALGLALPISAAIAALMIAVGLSYRQTIRAYPHGGGSYIVASDNLGALPGLVAAAGLMTDYILTVAISVAAGVAAVTSALPALAGHTVPVGLAVIGFLFAVNLRGVRQAGVVLAWPTYAFISAMALLIVVGLVHAAGDGFQAHPPPAVSPAEGLGLLLVLRAFGSGATAMTGIEAISDGVPAFRPTEWRNARTTLTIMVSLLVLMFAGTTLLVHLDGLVPVGSQTVLSQLGHRELGDGPLYFYLQAATALVLLFAANTSFSDFPRLLFFLARDANAPKAFLRMGDRLAFTNGIALLAGASALIYLAFGGDTGRLIPLYAVGVFIAFTLSQTGMVAHWLRVRGRAWRRSMAFNATGAALSALVLAVEALTKFTEGAWIVVLLIPAIVLTLRRINSHYQGVRKTTRLRALTGRVSPGAFVPRSARRTGPPWASEQEEVPDQIQPICVVPIQALDLPNLRALAYAASLRQPTLAVHVCPTRDEGAGFIREWRVFGDPVPLEVISSPYRAIVPPLVHYLRALHAQRPELTITVVLSELVVEKRWQRLLHDETSARIAAALRDEPNTVIAAVPFHIAARSHPTKSRRSWPAHLRGFDCSRGDIDDKQELSHSLSQPVHDNARADHRRRGEEARAPSGEAAGR
jgi:amino acid transporter